MSKVKEALSLVRKNFSYLLVAEVAIRLMTFILTITIARVYGPEGFGIYTLALAVGSLFEIIFNMGIGTIFLQRVSANTSKLADDLSIFLPLRFILSVVGLIVSTIFIFLLNKAPDTFLTLLLGALYFSLFSTVSFLWACFDAKQKMHFNAIIKFIKYTVLFGFGIIFIYQMSPIYFMMIAYISGTIAAAIITIILIRKYFTRIKLKIDFKEWKKIISEGWPITVSAAFVFIYTYLDTIMLSIAKGEEIVGYYQASYKIIGTLFILATIINQAYFPSLIKSHNSSTKDLSIITNSALKTGFFWSIPITLGAFILADRIMLFVFGSDFTSGITSFKILIWTCIIFFFSSNLTNLLYAVKKQKKAMKIFFTGAVLNVILNVYLIPNFGIEGASLSTIFSELIVLYGIYHLAKKEISIKLFRNIAPALISGIFMITILQLFYHESLILTISIGALIYFASYFSITKLRSAKQAV